MEEQVDALALPHIEHVGGVTPAHMHHVSADYQFRDVVVLPVEQVQMPGPAAGRVEGLIEGNDVARVIAGRRAQEKDSGVAFPGQLEDIVMQRVVASVHD